MTPLKWTGVGLGALLLVLTLLPSRNVVASGANAFPDAHMLDGMEFVGEMSRDGRDVTGSTRFAFADGRFHAAGFGDYGFGDAGYTSRTVDGRPQFAASVAGKRSTGGRMVWAGTLDGDVLEGTLRWDHGWESRRYRFRAVATAPTSR